MNTILALAGKDLRLLVRDRFALFWILAFPLMFALFFGAIFGGGDDGGRAALPLAVVDDARSEQSAALLASLAGNASLQLDRRGDEAGAPVAPVDLDAAREAVQKGRRAAYLRIPAGYADSAFAMFGGGGPDRPALEIGIDPARRAEAGVLQGVVMEAVFAALQRRFGDREAMQREVEAAQAQVAAAADLPPAQKAILRTFLGALGTFFDRFDGGDEAAPDGSGGGAAGFAGPRIDVVDVTRERGRRPRSAFDVTFPQALVWGLMSVAMAFAITLVRERSSGTLLRLRLAPIARAQMLAGKAAACFAACMLTMAALLCFGVVALGVQIGSPPHLLLAMVCTAACFTGLMMTVSVLGKTESAVAGSSWGVMMPFAMIGGGMIPLIAMPSWLVTASALSPFKWAITAIEGAMWRGFTPGELLLPCALLVAIGAGFFALGVAVFRRSDG